jgi:hypothetical protein
MKNIHLLPTEKPSRLTKINDELFFGKNEREMLSEPSLNIVAQHIYITSDEEIKEGDWGLSKLNEIILFGRSYNEKFYKKIILTTDQDLIADGVQGIDDEFLEWFVKNPGCESVELKKGFEDGTAWGYNFLDYKIIIPQEEPNPFELPKALPDEVFYQSLEPKQETLEEAAENYCSNSHAINEDRAAWQDIEFAFNDGAKWQSERMYSEEEVKQIIDATLIEHSDFVLADIPEWFEQFKKK